MRLISLLALIALLPACGGGRDVVPSSPPSATEPSLPIVRIHAVQDLMKRMLPIQFVGPEETTDVRPIDGVIGLVHEHFLMLERTTPKIVAHGKTLVVTGSNADHDEVDAALEAARTTLSEVGR